MSLSAEVITAIQEIHQAQAEDRAQKVAFLQALIQGSMAEHAGVCARGGEAVQEDDTLHGKDKDGLTPLMWAAKLGLPDVMTILMAGRPEQGVAGATLDAVDNKGRTVMHHAASADQVNVVKFLCESDQGRALLAERDKEGEVPLFSAAGGHAAHVLQYLIQEQKADVNAITEIKQDSRTYKTPIVARVLKLRKEDTIDEKRVIACLEILRDAKADFNAPLWVWSEHNPNDTYSRSCMPLGLAASYGLPDAVNFMLENGALPNSIDKEPSITGSTCTMLHRAIAKIGWYGLDKVPLDKRVAIVRALTNANIARSQPISDKELTELLDYAIKQAKENKDSVDGLRALLRVPQFLALAKKSCEKQFLALIEESPYYWSDQAKAARRLEDNLALVQLFIDEKAVTQDMVDRGVKQAAAGKAGDIGRRFIKALCEATPAPSRGEVLNGSLGYRIDRGDPEGMITLIIAGADPTRTARESKTAIDVLVDDLVVKAAAKETFFTGRTSLAFFEFDKSAEINAQYQTSFNRLIDFLALPQVKENEAAMRICRKKLEQLKKGGDKYKYVVSALEEHGVTVEVPAVEAKSQPTRTVGGYAMHPAPFRGVAAAAAAGPVPTGAGVAPAAGAGAAKAAEPVKETKASSLVDSILQGDQKAFNQHLEQKSDVNFKDGSGCTALHYIVQFKDFFNADDLKRLLDAKADMNLINQRGETPLIRAARIGNGPAVKLLLERGAKKDCQDRDKKTAEDYLKTFYPKMHKEFESLFHPEASAGAGAGFVAANTRV